MIRSAAFGIIAFAGAGIILVSLSPVGCGEGNTCTHQWGETYPLNVSIGEGERGGTVTTFGACTPASCLNSTEAGCQRWQATMSPSANTDGGPPKCTVTLSSLDGSITQLAVAYYVPCLVPPPTKEVDF